MNIFSSYCLIEGYQRLSVHVNDCEEMMKVQLIVRLYANCIIVCLKYAVDCQNMQ